MCSNIDIRGQILPRSSFDQIIPSRHAHFVSAVLYNGGRSYTPFCILGYVKKSHKDASQWMLKAVSSAEYPIGLLMQFLTFVLRYLILQRANHHTYPT
jgi:hypothetical protein